MDKMKTISFQRMVSFLLTERTVKSYEKFVNKKFELMDSPSGQTSWCDFSGAEEWGECVNVIQKSEGEYLFKNLFKIGDLNEIEQRYGVKVELNSIPMAQGMESREYPLGIKDKIRQEVEKKLKKTYPHQANSYPQKGILIVGILDLFFCGFKNDIEISQGYLDALAVDIEPFFQQSSFSSILLVDAMNPFGQDFENSTYKLKE
jgi:hypothetical protein